MFLKSSDQKREEEFIIQGPGVHDLPSSTKSGSDNPGLWYKQFARNMGMRGKQHKTYMKSMNYQSNDFIFEYLQIFQHLF